MEDVMGKLGELLSDEESVRQLTELAQMMMSGDTAEGDSGGEAVSQEGGGPDLGALIKISSMIGTASQNDKNAELLLALRPHLREEKQKRVDKALKLLKLLAVWNMAKESGLLNDLI